MTLNELYIIEGKLKLLHDAFSAIYGSWTVIGFMSSGTGQDEKVDLRRISEWIELTKWSSDARNELFRVTHFDWGKIMLLSNQCWKCIKDREFR